jgi:hypothetical protein
MVDLVLRANFKTLGWVGVVVLFLTVVQVLGSMEASFNRVWGVYTSRALVAQIHQLHQHHRGGAGAGHDRLRHERHPEEPSGVGPSGGAGRGWPAPCCA